MCRILAFGSNAELLGAPVVCRWPIVQAYVLTVANHPFLVLDIPPNRPYRAMVRLYRLDSPESPVALCIGERYAGRARLILSIADYHSLQLVKYPEWPSADGASTVATIPWDSEAKSFILPTVNPEGVEIDTPNECTASEPDVHDAK